jgi:hypothetical protein
MENGTDQNGQEENEQLNENAAAQPNTENGDLEYTESEVPFADGAGTLLDEEITDQDDDDPED